MGFRALVLCLLFAVLTLGDTGMVHPEQQGSAVNVSEPDSSCLIAQIPGEIGETVANHPSIAYAGCHTAAKLNLTQFIPNPSAWKSLADVKPTVNVTAACAAHCVRNNTYKQFQLAIVGGVHCYCIDEVDRVKTVFHFGAVCQPWISNSTLQVRVYSATLQCPLNLTLCTQVRGCELKDAPDGCTPSGEQCCIYNSKDKDRRFLGFYSGMFKYVILIIFAMACIEAVIYGVMKRRAYLRGDRFAYEERDADEANDLSEALIGTFPTIEPKAAAPASPGTPARTALQEAGDMDVEMGEVKPEAASLIRPGSENHCVITPSPLAAAVASDGTDDDDAEHCSICLDDMNAKQAVKLPCNHTMHSDCLKEFMRHELRKKDKIPCPMCRATIGSAKDARRPALAVPAVRTQ